MDKCHRAREIRNESGRFEVDGMDQLIRFSADPQNVISMHDWYPIGCRRGVEHLHIPEGVKFIGNGLLLHEYEDFSNLFVAEEVALPKSLLCIRGNAFRGCLIHKIVLPSTLRQLGGAVFMHCFIDCFEVTKSTLRLEHEEWDVAALKGVPEDELLFEMRCFKESLIREVRAEGLRYGKWGSGYELEERPTEELIREILMRDAQIIRIVEQQNAGHPR